MATPTVNILRWSFLAFGVLYGFQHQRTLYKQEKDHHAKQEWERKEKLIAEAKEEYKKSLLPPDQRNTGTIFYSLWMVETGPIGRWKAGYH
ncbi:hypothetical protein ABW19_dt0202760 [Dactylella cylindrospora]|nr:hypothetical protein ABW19_dt0202760 [Dactylella cylindrospora]